MRRTNRPRRTRIRRGFGDSARPSRRRSARRSSSSTSRAATAARSRWGPRRPDRPSSSDSSPPRGPRPTRWRVPADGPPSGSGSETPRPSTARRAGRFTSRGEMGGGRGRGPDGPRFSFPGDAELPPSKCLGRWELDTTIYCACNGDTRLLFG